MLREVRTCYARVHTHVLNESKRGGVFPQVYMQEGVRGSTLLLLPLLLSTATNTTYCHKHYHYHNLLSPSLQPPTTRALPIRICTVPVGFIGDIRGSSVQWACLW